MGKNFLELRTGFFTISRQNKNANCFVVNCFAVTSGGTGMDLHLHCFRNEQRVLLLDDGALAAESGYDPP